MVKFKSYGNQNFTQFKFSRAHVIYMTVLIWVVPPSQENSGKTYQDLCHTSNFNKKNIWKRYKKD